jgi:hypothetical protein
LSLHISKRLDEAMAEPTYNYDEASDTLYVSFVPGKATTGIALNDYMFLRIDRDMENGATPQGGEPVHERSAVGAYGDNVVKE